MSQSDSPPIVPPDSPGSSVSTRLQDEYEEFLRYAVVIPNLDKDPPTAVSTYRDTSGHEHVQTLGNQKVNLSTAPCYKRTDMSENSAKTSYLSETSDIIPSVSATDVNRERRRDIIDVEEEVYVTTIDPDVKKMEMLMDQLCTDMKRNVMGEFSQAKIKIIERNRIQMMKDKEVNFAEKKAMLSELDSVKELLHTYEQTITRKDQIISNLTAGLGKHKQKCDMAKTFCEWKHRHGELKREAFTSCLAKKHHDRKILQKVLGSWKSVIVSKWRQRVEKACQAKAQEVCLQLTNEYETKIASLTDALEDARGNINRLHRDREQYEETMKKAFMRGVCALNLEAMNMFQPEDEEGDIAMVADESSVRSQPKQGEQPAPRIVTSQGSRPVTQSTALSAPQKQIHAKTVSSSKGKTFTAKISARSDSSVKGVRSSGGNPTLNPPMSSVVVERHLPVNKETLGKATASKYVQPRPQSVPDSKSSPRIGHRKIAGQDGPPIIIPNVQPIKVVD